MPSDSDYGRDWNIGLYDIVSPASTRKVEKSGSLIYKGRVVQGKVTHGYCPFCSYASTNHCTLNNHIQMHLRLTLACGMKDCWFVTHNSDVMWKHAAYHGLNTSEPIVCEQKEVNTGRYPYFTLNHQISQPMRLLSHQVYRVIPRIPEMEI